MALGYEVTITDSKGGEIKLSSMETEGKGKGDIIGASFKSNTINDDSMSRSNDVRAEVKLVGRITTDNYKEICKLAVWSNETVSDLQYRKVKLVIHPTSEDSTVIRSYEIAQMFVLDYEESFEMPVEYLAEDSSKEVDNGVFVMYLAQKSGKYELYVETE